MSRRSRDQVWDGIRDRNISDVLHFPQSAKDIGVQDGVNFNQHLWTSAQIVQIGGDGRTDCEIGERHAQARSLGRAGHGTNQIAL